MIAGLPAATWVLMAFAVVPGIVLVTAAYRVHRRGDAQASAPRGDGGDAAGVGSGGHAPEPERQPGAGAPRQATQRGEGGRG